jgi:adenine-specific DNA-methyltransferase
VSHVGALSLDRAYAPVSLVDRVDVLRVDASRKLDPERRVELGQFLTPPGIARFMASMFTGRRRVIRLLDAGAGVGSLTVAFVEQACKGGAKPAKIIATAYELDPSLAARLRQTLDLCKATCLAEGVQFEGEVRGEDFIRAGAAMLDGGLFARMKETYDCIILNPPYRKIHSASEDRRLMRAIGVETNNLYTAFLAIAVRLLEPGGELVAITPRSFCNGPYFRPFRELFLEAMSLRRVHVFESRDRAFRDDDVLQENIIFHAEKGGSRTRSVIISASVGPDAELSSSREVRPDQMVRPEDLDHVIHLVPDELGERVVERMETLGAGLADLDVEVSTGRVVDFRVKEHLRPEPGPGTAPLVYPCHFSGGFVSWPKLGGKKPNAVVEVASTRDLLLPSGTYVVVKRFSAKEERRRVVAAVYDPKRIAAPAVGFENHLNVYHRDGAGLPPMLARGLALFLNSTLVDAYFRQFSGHTQVNASDLRSLRYPSAEELIALGKHIGARMPEQDEIDRLVEKELFNVDDQGPEPTAAKKQIDEALAVLRALGFHREQQNERSALTLLALLDLKPGSPWSTASFPLRGITPMMDFFATHYGKRYKPNTRESVRRLTVHQFLDAALIVANPDAPKRAVNSGKTVYQIEPSVLALLQTFGSPAWETNLRDYLTSVAKLKRHYAQDRDIQRLPVTVGPGQSFTLSPGGQNALVKEIVDEFHPRFAPQGRFLYVGDAETKWAHFEAEALEALGVSIDAHGKMPDVVIHDASHGWLLLIEAVTSHGPVNPKRRSELATLFKGCSAGLVFVTAFLDRKTMMKYINDISWETEVWIADAPSHMIHFNGDRFLGPY